MSGSSLRPDRPLLTRPISLVAIAAAGIALLVGWLLIPSSKPIPLRQLDTRSPAPAPEVATPVLTAPGVATPAPQSGMAPPPVVSSTTTGPKFDIARIAPDGNAVIAGQAKPGAQVTIMDGNQAIGQVEADARGTFVFLPPTPLASGTRELHLSERAPDGTQTKGSEQVVLVVPPRAGGTVTATAPALALLTAPNAAPRLLQTPLPPVGTDAAPDPGARTRLGLDLVDYDASGEIRFSGTAPAGATLRIYVDNQPIGTATADPAARWSFQAPGRVPAGEHQLRLDQLGAAGQVTARVELPFRREAQINLQAGQPTAGGEAQAGRSPARQGGAGGQIVVQPGDSLWLLARQSYGEGLRYTAIHAANRAHIRDPNMIYPGQVLAVPSEASSSTSASSNRSR